MRKNIWMGLLLLFGMLVLGTCKVSAAEQITGTMQTVTEDTIAYDSMSTDGNQVTIPAGSMMLVSGEEGGWTHVFYNGSELYIHSSDGDAIEEIENGAAANELEKAAQTDKAWIESFEAQTKAARYAMIWRIAIAVVIVASVATIIIASVRRKNYNSAEENRAINE